MSTVKRSSCRLSVLGFAGVLLSGHSALAEPPHESRESRELRELAHGVYSSAVRLRESAPKCTPGERDAPPPEADLAAEVLHEQSAAIFGALVLSLHQPASGTESAERRTGRIEQLTDMLNRAVAEYREAYACHPGRAGARHLEAALALTRAYERGLRVKEQLPENDPAYKVLRQHADELGLDLPEPPPCPVVEPCRARPQPGPVDQLQSTGYDRRAYGRIFLRTELGVGWGRLRYQQTESKVVGPTMRVAMGLRQLVGAKDRVVLLLGGFYSFQHVSSADETSGDLSAVGISSRFRMIHAGGLTFESAIRFSGGVVSVHPAVEFGVQAFHAFDSFGSFRLGGGLGLCFGEQIFCIMPRFHTGLQASKGAEYAGAQIGLGFDLFRAIDRSSARMNPR